MGGKQLGFSDYELTTAKKQTKREKILSDMEVVVTWQALIDLNDPQAVQPCHGVLSAGSGGVAGMRASARDLQLGSGLSVHLW